MGFCVIYRIRRLESFERDVDDVSPYHDRSTRTFIFHLFERFAFSRRFWIVDPIVASSVDHGELCF